MLASRQDRLLASISRSPDNTPPSDHVLACLGQFIGGGGDNKKLQRDVKGQTTVTRTGSGFSTMASGNAGDGDVTVRFKFALTARVVLGVAEPETSVTKNT